MPKYKYQGYEYSEEEIISAAEQNNLSLEDYINKFELEVVSDEVETVDFQTDPAKETADVGSETPAVDTELASEVGSLELQDGIKTQEKNTWLEDTFGKDTIGVDFISDIYRAWEQGWTQAEALDASLALFSNGPNLTDAEYKELIEAGRAIEEVGQTDEQIQFGEDYTKLKEEYGGVGAFFAGWWKNPTVMAQYTTSSLANMARSTVEAEALAAGAAGAGTMALSGAAVGSVAPGIGNLIGGGAGLVGGFMGGVGAVMETGATTAQLIQEAAQEQGKDWAKMSDQERINWVKTAVADEKSFNEIKNKALARGLTIGAIDAITGVVSGGAGKAARMAATGAVKAGIADVATTAAVETVGGMASEIGGQLAAGQDLDAQEILTEGFADKTFTAVNILKGGLKGPTYKINGETLSGNNFAETIKIMDDVAITEAKINVDNDPVMEKIISNRREDIKIDLDTDARVNNVDDRAKIIELQRKVDKLKNNNTVSGQKQRSDATQQIKDILDKYKDNEVDVTIKDRQKAVAKARKNALENSFNKNVEKVSEVAQKLGFDKPIKVVRGQKALAKTIAEDTGQSIEDVQKALDDSLVEGVYAGDGRIYIDKNTALKMGNVNVASHELLHPVLNALVGNKESQGETVGGIKKLLNKKQLAWVENELNTNYDPEEHDLEFLTVFSNGIQNGDIKYEESVFDQIKTFIEPILQKLGFENINFDNAKGVYNFLKEYNTTINSEQGLSAKAFRAIEKAQTEKGVKVSEAPSIGVQASKKLAPEASTQVAEKITEIKNLQKEGEALAEKFNKEFIKSPKQIRIEQQLSETIAPALNSLAESTTKRLYDPIAPDAKRSVSRQDYKDALKANWTSMVINEFDSTKQDVETFLSTRGNLRANSLAKELGIEGVSEGGIKADVTEQKALTTDDQTDVSIDEGINIARRESKLINPVDLIPDKNLREKYENTVKEKVKDLDTKGLSFKKLKDLAPEVTAELFGIPVKKVTDATANLSSGDLSSIQNFINKNADLLLKLLPEGGIDQNQAASESLIGTSTGVARKLLDAFYDPKPRVTKGAGLAIQKKRKGITRREFLEAFGIVDGKKLEGLSPRSPQAQAMKGMVSLFGRMMTNTIVRQELSQQPGTEATVQDIAAGKAPLQFSTTAKRNEAYKGAKTISEHGIDSKQFKDLKVSKEVKQLLKKLANKKLITGNTFNGIVYEEITSNDIKIYAKELGLDLKVLDNNSAGYDSTKPDIQIKAKRDIGDNIIVNLEVKKDKYARFGSVTFRFNFDNIDKPKIEIVQNRKIVKPGEIQNEEVFMSILNEATPYIKEILNTINEIEGTSYNSFPLGSKIKATTFEKLKQTNAFANLKSIQKGLNSSVIAQHYNKKGNYYIQIGKSGLYYLGEDVYNIGVPRLDVVFSGSINLKRSGIKDGMTTISLRSEPKIKKAGQLKKSNIDLNAKEGVKEFDQKVKTSTFQASKKARSTREKILDTQFNNILENKTGIASEKIYSKAKAEVVGASKGKFNWFIPPTAEDFVGLLYQFLGKGKNGDLQMAWFKVNILNPYAKAMSKFTRDRVSTARNYRALKKQLKIVPKNLKKKIPGEDFTIEQALRVYLWTKLGYEIPGLSAEDAKPLRDFVKNNDQYKDFAEKLLLVNQDDYAKPKDGWLAGTITTDLLESLNEGRRTEYLKDWQENVDAIFSEDNLNKIEAAYGSKFRYALENSLTRMKTGRNRTYGTDSLTGRVVDWLTNSIGAIMFFNTRSAILQTLSSVNFINFSDNNVLAAGKAFANQKQYWSDFLKLFNSDFLIDRRDGLRLNVNESDIADMAKQGGVRGVVSEILKAGFLPTQMADSFAIASGGATFYRNRLKRYIKEGIDPKKAEEMAFMEFREIAEESQQSSRPDKISAQQAGPLGRIILAFANTPAQYARLMKKAASDLKNGRGDAKSNISKIIYYGVAQNLIFNAMQQALFAVAFGDEEEDEEEKKQKKAINIANGMADSVLRGMGISGAVFSVLKNTVKKLIERSEKKQPDYAENALMELLKISPPVSSKASKVKNALRSYEWDKDEMYEKGLALDNPAYLAAGNIVSAATNVPLDRAVKKVTNVKDATGEDLELWQRLALLGGWSAWELGVDKEEEKSSRAKTKYSKTKYNKTKY